MLSWTSDNHLGQRGLSRQIHFTTDVTSFEFNAIREPPILVNSTRRSRFEHPQLCQEYSPDFIPAPRPNVITSWFQCARSGPTEEPAEHKTGGCTKENTRWEAASQLALSRRLKPEHEPAQSTDSSHDHITGSAINLRRARDKKYTSKATCECAPFASGRRGCASARRIEQDDCRV